MNHDIDIVRSGFLTTIQDAGRPGYAHMAVPTSGALDGPALRLANRLVGNAEDSACLETTLDGVTLRAQRGCYVAVTGALAPIRRDHQSAGWAVPIRLSHGQLLDVSRATHGIRNYVAISGGIAATRVLGSRSTDLLSGLGPSPVQDGDELALGSLQGDPSFVDFAPYALPGPPTVTLELYPGPRTSWLTAKSRRLLTNSTWVVTHDGNRVGIRLNGPSLQRSVLEELPSEGLVLGSVQIPANGLPVIFLADHPTTGGYPVVGVVAPHDLSLCAQATPGTIVRFSPTGCWPSETA